MQAELHQQVAELRAAKDSAAESLAQATKHDTEVTKEAALLKQHIKTSAAKLQDMKAALAAAEGSASAQAKELVELQSQVIKAFFKVQV
jgi:chromosome segregation ATPase